MILTMLVVVSLATRMTTVTSSTSSATRTRLLESSVSQLGIVLGFALPLREIAFAATPFALRCLHRCRAIRLYRFRWLIAALSSRRVLSSLLLRRNDCWVLFFQVCLRLRCFFLLRPLNDLEVLHMVNFEHNRWNGVLVRLNLILAVSSTLSTKRSHVLEVHGALGSVDLHKSAFVPHQGIRDQ